MNTQKHPQQAAFFLFSKDFVAGAVSGIVFFFLLANIVASQTISPLYFRLVRGDKNAAVTYLHTIQHDPSYPQALAAYRERFGQDVDMSILAQNKSQDDTINKLEQLLRDFPNNRDILYSLYQLYSEKRDTSRASDYLRQAQAIDPTVGN